MKNLVTGGTGFLGSHLVEALLARGEDVRALARPTGETTHLERLGVELVHGELGDAQSLQRAVGGVGRIYHCAALASDWGPWKAFRDANVDGLRHLLDAAVELFGTDQGFPIHKARDQLGYEPAVPFEQGMRLVESWLRETGYI